ncbi:MAG: IclR family transcriptional regulator [Desulfotignum sp.]|nr:IclR family transcriptional regulator [Desulfotignum sp.]MCF8112644.1 IclR family transcriptional regulator [Desulfotignum sp.]MCF8124796.1 IclR family transcriptional regulator [Desulfotignum sp.]
MTEKKYYNIASLEKGIKTLELLAAHGELSVSEAARLMDTNRAGSHRFISTLKDLGYVEKNSNNKYQPTLKIMTLAQKVADRFEIRRMAKPHMHRLSMMYKETINLGLFKNQEIIHIDKIDSLEVLRMDSALGDKAPAYCTGLGKCILAFLPDHELDHYLNTVDRRPLAPNTITDKTDFLKELSRIRRNRYAIDDEEMTIGLRCIAVPIFDHNNYPAYALSISGPAMRLTHRALEDIKDNILKVSEDLSRKMGNA